MQAALVELPTSTISISQRTTIAPDRSDLSMLARQHLERHPHFRGRLSGLRIEHRGHTLFLSGRLPSFYLKQLVQEAVRHLPGIQRVRNEIDVVCPYGVSSVR